MKKAIILCFIGLVLAGCAQFTALTNENPAIVSIAVHQAVFRYIDVGDTKVEKEKRANEVVEVLQKVQIFAATDITTVDKIIEFAAENINWNKLSPADRLAVRDVLLLIDLSFKDNQRKIDPQTSIAVNSIITAAMDAAKMF